VVNEPRDSEDGTVEEEEVMAGQGDANTPDQGAEGYGIRHPGGRSEEEELGGVSPWPVRQRPRARADTVSD